MKHFFWTVFFLSFWATAVLAQEGQTPLLEVSFDNTSRVTSASFSPDAKTVLCGYNDGTAKLWDFKGTVLQTFTGHTKGLTSVDFSPDGKTIWTSSKDGTAKLWNLEGMELQIFSKIPREIYGYGVAFSPDGKTLLFAGGKVQLWDLNGQELQTFKSALGRVTAMAFSPDGNTVLCGGDRSKSILFDLNGKEIRTFHGPPGDPAPKVISTAFSPDGKSILTSFRAFNGETTTILWGLNGQQISTFRGGSENATFSPDGKSILIFKTLFDLKGQKLQTFGVHIPEVSVTSGAFSPDGKTVLTGKYNRKTGKFWIQQWPVLQPAPPTEVATPEQKVTPAPPTKQTPPAEVATREQQASPAQPTKQTPSPKVAAATPAPPGDQTPRLVVPLGHSGSLNTVAFSPDGKYILTGSADNTARLWDRAGRELQTFEGHSRVVTAAAFSPDGQKILTSSWDRKTKLWDVASGRVLETLPANGNISAISSDGKMFLTDVPNKREANGTVSFPVRLWDLSSGREIRTFTGHSSFVKAVAISPDGKFILTGSEDKTARLWDVASGSSLHTFPGNSFILDVAFSPNGKYALIDNGDGKVKLWDLASKNALHVFNGQFVAFSPDSKYALTGSYDKTAKLWDITSGRLIKTFSEHEGPVKAVAFSPDGKYILTGSDDKTAKLWAVTSERSLQTFVGRVSGVTCAAMAPDGKTILAGYSDEKLKQWDLFDRALKTLSSKTGYLTSLTFSPDSKFILTGSGNSAKLSDFSGSAQQTFTGHAGEINTVAISSDGQYILTGSWDNTAKLWDRSGNILQTLTGHTGIVLSVAISPNGQYLLTGSEDKTAKLWDRASGRMLKTLNGKYNGSVETVAFSPDGKMALTPGGFENTLKLWEIPSGREIKTLSPSHKRKIMSAAFSPDGKYVLTGSTDNTAKLYDVSTGREIKTFADNGSFFRVAFSPDGKYVLTSGLDKIVKLWDVNTGEKLASLISFNTDDDWVVTTPSGLFDASPGAMKGMHFMVGLEVVTLEQLKKRYYEPGLLAKVLGLAPGGLRPVAELNKVELYPEITSATIENDRLQVQLQERNGGIGKVALLLDGNIELEANVNPDFNAAFEVDLNRFAGYFIDEGINHLSLLTYNSKGWLTGESYPLDYRPSGVRDRGGNTPLTKANAKKDVQLESINFYALVVGTSVYSGGTLTLKYPDKDATAFAEALRLTGGKLFGNNIEVNLLTTSAEPWPRKAEIAKALREIAAKADPNDILLVYLSGHGITYPPNSEKGQFYYLTTDIMDDKLDDSDLLNAQAIAQDTLQEWIRQVKARKRILILDACNSGKVVESLNPGEKALNSDQRRALERMKDRSGMFVLAGSAADKSSFEASRFGHGLLTYSLLNNMPLVAASNKTYIDVGKLFGNTLEEVPRLAEDIGKVQKPELIGAGSFDIGIIDKATIFKTPQTIPVFLRTNFMDGQKFKDLQYLSKAVNDELNKRASFKKPGLAFWDIAEYTGEHYYLGGQYRTNGETIEGKATMYRKDKELAQFPFSGPASDLKALADEIVNQAFDHYNQEIENKQKKE